jgi:glutathione S-transferase
MLQLHGFAQSGNTFKVAFLLRALGVPWQAVHVTFADFAGGVTRSDDWRSGVNAMGEVPVLDDGQRRLTQSGVILTHLADRHGRFGGRDADERLEVLRWLLFDNHKFTSYFASYRFAKAFGATAPEPAVMNWLRGRMDNAFGIVEKRLQAAPFLVGELPTIADFSLSGYLFYPVEESGYDFPARYPAMRAWLDRLRTLPGWGDPYEVLPGERVAPRW